MTDAIIQVDADKLADAGSVRYVANAASVGGAIRISLLTGGTL